MNTIRVRFAPSPTGALHLGGARTALFNWLFARSNSGSFIVRLEDTDFERSSEKSAQAILEDLRWLGLEWDEGPNKEGNFGPYKQSERLSIYNQYIEQLIASGKAYCCFCTADELAKERGLAHAHKKNYLYSGKCKTLTAEKVDNLIKQGQKPVVRIVAPKTGTTRVNDLIRGSVEFSNLLFDDFIILKSDGWPTYNFAVVVDDYTMQISHVIRAEEHLSNTPKQLIIYEALDFKKPYFAHVSMILAPDRSKLSKRHGAVSVQEFENGGYLPEALVNYLVLLGWSPGEDIDFISLNEMVSKFSLENVSRSAAVYDLDKLLWMNGQYLARKDSNEIASLLEEKAINQGWLEKKSYDYYKKTIGLVKNRAKNLDELFEMLTYFFEEVHSYEQKGVNKYFYKADSPKIFEILLQILNSSEEFSAENLEKVFRLHAEQHTLKAADLIHPARLAITGRTATPGIFEVMEILGREECNIRVQQAVRYLQNNND